jgi:drug/metabolite transporter (DMT)-like permease
MAALVVAVGAVSTSAILIEFSAAPSLVKAFYRVLFTTLVVAPAALYRHPDAFGRLRRRDLLGAVGAGVALALHFGTWFESLEWTTVAASVTLVQAQPAFVAVGAALFLGERITRRVAAGIGVALGGMAVMAVGEYDGGPLLSSAALYGDALAVIGAAMVAVYYLAGRSLRQRVPLLPYVTVVYAVCAVVLGGLVAGAGHSFLEYPGREWLLFGGMALGPGVFGHTVINWALAHVESSVVSVTLLGEPVGSTLLALVLLAEVPGVATVAGGALALAGIYLTASHRERATPETAADGGGEGEGKDGDGADPGSGRG